MPCVTLVFRESATLVLEMYNKHGFQGLLLKNGDFEV